MAQMITRGFLLTEVKAVEIDTKDVSNIKTTEITKTLAGALAVEDAQKVLDKEAKKLADISYKVVSVSHLKEMREMSLETFLANSTTFDPEEREANKKRRAKRKPKEQTEA